MGETLKLRSIFIVIVIRVRTGQGISGKSGNLKMFFPEAKSQGESGNSSISSGKSGKIFFSQDVCQNGI